MAARPGVFTRGLSSLSQSHDADSPGVASPAEQRDSAKQNFLKTMRALPTQHYWHVYFDGQPKDQQDSPQESQQQQSPNQAAAVQSSEQDQHLQQTSPRPASSEQHDPTHYHAQVQKLDLQIESVQDFWRYHNNTPVDQIRMRESIYLFKSGFRPVWEDRRNVLGGSWTFRVPKAAGPDIWTRIQLLAIGEKLQEYLEEGDQLCGVGLSVRFNAHLITIWHRDSSKKASIDGLLRCVLDDLPPELAPKPDTYFYKRHADHAGFNAPPELQAVVDSQRAREAAAAAAV